MNASRPKTALPGWLVAIAVLLTAGVTAWAMLGRSPVQGWPQDAASLPQEVTQALSPAVMTQSPLRPVAATGLIPPIRAGAPSTHGDRGACTACHVVLSAAGTAVPMIQATAALPHQYRGGVCTNCHLLKAALAAIGFGAAQPAPQATLPAAGPVPLAIAGTAPTEGAWLGLEVSPLTALTAQQYGLPAGTGGVVVAEAEAQAATSGLLAGDLIATINGIAIGDLQTFLQVTQNGALAGGTVEVVRGGKLLRAALGTAQGLATQAQTLPAAGAGTAPCWRR